MFLDERLNTMKIPVLSTLVYRFNVISLKVPAVYVVEMYKLIPNEMKGAKDTKKIFKELEQSERTNTNI